MMNWFDLFLATPDECKPKVRYWMPHAVVSERGIARDLADILQPMDFVAGVDPLRRVAAEKVLIELQTAEFFQNRNAFFFGAAGVNR